MKIVTTVEMQSRLCEIFTQQNAELIQVTHQGKPVVAVLSLKRYQAFLAQVTYPQGEAVVAVLSLERYQIPLLPVSNHPTRVFEVSREPITQGQLLFHSYSKRLAPRLQGHEHLVKIIEVTRRKKLVGALLAWDEWLHLDETQGEEPPQEEHMLPVTAARNHLLKMPEQFAREEQAGIFAPITVIKEGEPVMAIVSWQWFQYVTKALHTLVESNGKVRRVSSRVEPPQVKDEQREEREGV